MTSTTTHGAGGEPVLVKKVSPKVFAEENSVSTMTIYRALKANQIPGAVKLRGQWRIPRDATLTA